jgi:DNA-directed RNA polymerase specialized sigma subunit
MQVDEKRTLNDEQRKLITDNIGLVYYFLRKNCGENKSFSPDKENELLGFLENRLCRAALNWKKGKKVKFSSYLTIALQSAIKDYIDFLNSDYYKRCSLCGSFSNFCKSVKKRRREDCCIVDWDYMVDFLERVELSQKERNILNAKYRDNLTYREIACTVGLSQERIRQINSKSIRKIKRAANREGKEFDDFIVKGDRISG